MKTPVATLLVVGALVAAGVGTTLVALALEAEPPAANHVAPASAPHARHGHAGAHPWEGGAGNVPTLEDALLTLERRGAIRIVGDAAFNPENGVRGGRGTFDDPFVISGWHVDTVLIADTSKAFEVKENYVSRILVLDWTGPGGYVHHNHVANLRTNRNVERTGDASATVIEKNQIDRVEELRHFDGIVRNNTLGKPDALALPLARQGEVVLNIAGLNGAGIHDNVIFGGVDMKIHGHHHSDAPGAHSHNHGTPDAVEPNATHAEHPGAHVEDHQTRYVDFHFYGNRIVDDGFGLRYNDLAHAGDDRTATSEQEPELEKPHVHFTSVRIHDNVIEGATLRIAVLNAADERHVGAEHATLVLQDNRIVKPLAGDGIVIQDVRNAEVRILGNKVERGDLQLAGTSAVLLQRFQNATILVDDNTFGAYKFGVRAREFDASTRWIVGQNAGPAKTPVYWDDTVANPPEGMEDAAGHEGHDHDHGAAPAQQVALRRGLAVG